MGLPDLKKHGLEWARPELEAMQASERRQDERVRRMLAELGMFDPKPKEARRCREFAQALGWRCA